MVHFNKKINSENMFRSDFEKGHNVWQRSYQGEERE